MLEGRSAGLQANAALSTSKGGGLGVGSHGLRWGVEGGGGIRTSKAECKVWCQLMQVHFSGDNFCWLLEGVCKYKKLWTPRLDHLEGLFYD